MIQSLLRKLKLENVNSGACAGPDRWYGDAQDRRLVSYNPANGEPLGSVIMASTITYDTVVQQAQSAFQTWRMIPAPKRGLVVRDLGNALREAFGTSW